MFPRLPATGPFGWRGIETAKQEERRPCTTSGVQGDLLKEICMKNKEGGGNIRQKERFGAMM